MRTSKRPILIGIAGGSGSGKTTYAELLRQSLGDLNCVLIHMDHYFKRVKPKITAPYRERIYEDYDQPGAIDIDRLLEDVRRLLAAGSTDVVVVEGLFALYFEELSALLDLKLYVDCQSDERLVRRLRRDLHEDTYENIVDVYLDLVRHRHAEFVEPTRWHADVVVNGAKITQRSVDVVRRWVQDAVSPAED